VPRARLGIERLPVGHDAARFAAQGPQGPIAPDVLLCVLGVAFNKDGSEFVVGPDAASAAAEGAVAARGLLWRRRKSEANCSEWQEPWRFGVGGSFCMDEQGWLQ
jgi:hypothetical protein